MKLNNHLGIPLLQFAALSKQPELYHGLTTRLGGISLAPFESLNLGLYTNDVNEHVNENHRRLSDALKIDPAMLISSRQVHGNAVARIDKPVSSQTALFADILSGYDALTTNCPGITLMIRIADCVPILLFDPRRKALALAHAGWKGTVAHISARTVEAMNDHFGTCPQDLHIGIGPSLGMCCFKIREDVAGRIAALPSSDTALLECDDSTFRADLKKINRAQLIDAGCLPGNIEMSDMCTACRSDLFFSHRGEQGETGRFGLLAGLAG